jgi:hypothetical protein
LNFLTLQRYNKFWTYASFFAHFCKIFFIFHGKSTMSKVSRRSCFCTFRHHNHTTTNDTNIRRKTGSCPDRRIMVLSGLVTKTCEGFGRPKRHFL